MSTRERRGSLISKTNSKDSNRHEQRQSPRMLRTTKTPSIHELKNKFKESPKGKRKLNFLTKGPLVGNSFYLDLYGYRHLAQIKKAIKQLSGTVEEFFHKDVKYLVTIRGNIDKSPSSQSAPSPATPSPAIPSPLLISQSSSIRSTAAPSPMSTDSPQGVDNRNRKPSHNTRGQAICNSVAGGQKRCTTDVLSNANTWGVTVVHVERVVRWLAKLMPAAASEAMPGKQQSSKTKRAIQGRVAKVVTLEETYLKVEDLSFKYKPLVHEFKTWPEITFDGSILCPFDPPKRRSSDNNTTKPNKKTDTKSFKRISVAERPKHGYCECCEVRYTDLQTHLKGEQHQKFAKTDSNYTSLDKAINSGQTIQDFLYEIRCKKNKVHEDSESKNNEKTPSSNQEMNAEVFLLSSPTCTTRSKQQEILLKGPLCADSLPSTKKIRRENRSCGSADESSCVDGRRAKPCKRRASSLGSIKKDAARTLSEGSLSRNQRHNETVKDTKGDDTIADGVKRDKKHSKPSPSSSNEHDTVNLTKICAVKSEPPSSPVAQDDNITKTEGRSSSRRKRYGVLQLSPVSPKITAVKSEPPSSPVAHDDNITKIEGRSSSRRKRYGDLQLSPILPCGDGGGRRSVPSSVEDNFLPSGFSVYSSLGSSLGDISRHAVDLIVNRIENQCNSDSNNENIDRNGTSPVVITKGPGKNRRDSNHICPAKFACVVEYECVKGEDEHDSPIIVKRKRSPNDNEDGQTRKCKRLSESSGSLSDMDDGCYRMSVAERVKIQRAIAESLLDVSHGEEEDASSSTTITTTKVLRKRRELCTSSPFAELTNNCPKRRARAKSDSKIENPSANSESQWSKKFRSKGPRSACLTPNDPFNFNDS